MVTNPHANSDVGPILADTHTRTHTEHGISEKTWKRAQTYPSDNLSNHSAPAATGVDASVATVLHQLEFVTEADHLWELSQQIHAEALQLRTAAHGVRLLLEFMEIVLDKKDSWRH